MRVAPHTSQYPFSLARLVSLREQLLSLRNAALAVEQTAEDEILLVHPDRRVEARNLVDYLALREQDIRDLQRELFQVGLSSLGVVQGHVMASINAVVRILDHLCDMNSAIEDSPLHPSLTSDRSRLTELADDTLGPAAEPRLIRLMVTMPSEAGDDPSIIESLLQQGMSVMRINCAHDGPDTWQGMVDNLRVAEAKVGRTCRIGFDLGGPKLRTGPVADGPEVIRYRPQRDSFGCNLAPCSIRFGAVGSFNQGDFDILPIEGHLLEKAMVGDTLHLEDARGRERVFSIVAATDASLLCTCDRTSYLMTGTRLELRSSNRLVASGSVGRLPPTQGAIPLAPGDSLVITRDLAPGRPAILDDDEEAVLEPATIGCSLPQVFEHIEVGHRVLLDDGKFEGVVCEVAPDRFRIEISRAGRGQAVLRAEKGINLSDTPLNLPALTAKDIQDLEFVVRHADLVALSFVHRTEDIAELYQHLDRLDAPNVGVILKIPLLLRLEDCVQRSPARCSGCRTTPARWRAREMERCASPWSSSWTRYSGSPSGRSRRR